MRRDSRLLVVDFDLFFLNLVEAGRGGPNLYLYDWGMRESPFHRELAWLPRAMAFLRAGLELPLCIAETDERGIGYRRFWDRFNIPDGTPLHIADSNAAAVDVINDSTLFSEVWLYDAHHDAGYRQSYEDFLRTGDYSCEDWLYVANAFQSRIVIRYPRWKNITQEERQQPRIPVELTTDDGRPVPHTFNAVFACRSGSWVPPWCDAQWREFVDSYKAGPVVDIEPEVLDVPRWSPQHEGSVRQAASMLGERIELIIPGDPTVQ